VIKRVIEESDRKYIQLMAENLTYEKTIVEQIGNIQETIKEKESMQKQMIERGTKVDATQILLLQSGLEEKQTRLLTFNKELRDLRISLYTETGSKKTRVENGPFKPEKPESRGTLKAILLAVMAGTLITALYSYGSEMDGRK
jgi:dynactin complex subunit